MTLSEKKQLLQYMIDRGQENLERLNLLSGTNREIVEEELKFNQYLIYLVMKDISIYTDDGLFKLYEKEFTTK